MRGQARTSAYLVGMTYLTGQLCALRAGMLLQVLTASAVISTEQNMLRDALPCRFRKEASFIVALHRSVSAPSVFSSEQRCQHVRGAQHEAKRVDQDT